MRLVHSTENARKNGNILNFKKSKDPFNHVAARSEDLVHLVNPVYLVYSVSLVSLNKSNKIDQTYTINTPGLAVLGSVPPANGKY